jgi:hypothetical protein
MKPVIIYILFIFVNVKMIYYCNFSSGFMPHLIKSGALLDAVPCRRPENGFDFTQSGIIHDATPFSAVAGNFIRENDRQTAKPSL